MTVRVGILGYGFMGRTHEAAFNAAAARGFDCTTRVVTLQEIIERDDIDAVCICTPTDTHIELASATLRAGKHVLLEKPVALRASEVAQLDAIARDSGRVCMPAHCMRFWPGWPYLRKIVQDATYGRVLSAAFRRISHQPEWNADFYGNITKSGGALFDLHVHDVDFILWCFGDPDAFDCAGSELSVETAYRYGDITLTALGEWRDDGAPFEMTYQVVLEGARLDFRHDREPALIRTRPTGQGEGTEPEAVDLPGPDAYQAQAEHFLRLVRGEVEPVVTLRDAEKVIRQLEEEKRRLQSS